MKQYTVDMQADTDSNNPSVMIDNCQITGTWDKYGLNVARFYSIPYILPPIDDLRWSNSILIENYSDPNTNKHGVCNNNNKINATYHRSRCYQPTWFNASNLPEWPSQSEDCVHLDIYTPTLHNTQESLPVFVYFHGGSLFNGGNFQYNFTNFSANMNVVVVVPNYRLGVLGFLAFKQLTQNSQTKTSGNYALFDLYTSLKWIQKYIGKFGGNSDDVTITGQSSGGTNVWLMMGSELTKGLFHRGIAVSPGMMIQADLSFVEKQGQVIVDAVGCNNSDYTNQQMVNCMRSINPNKLTEISWTDNWWAAEDKFFDLPGPDKTQMLYDKYPIFAMVDGLFLKQPLEDAINDGVNTVPLIVGDTQYEIDWAPTDNVSDLVTESQLDNYLNNNFKEWGHNFGSNLWKTYYSQEWNLGGSPLVYDAIAADSLIFCGNKYFASLAAKHTNVYVYSAQQWPSNPFQCNMDTGYECLYSFHGYDWFAATFDFGAFKYWGTGWGYKAQDTDKKFGQLIRDHWKNFIEHNEPMSNWKPYKKENNWNVALLGNGPNSSTEYNMTNMVDEYKTSVCNYYAENGISTTFWWNC
eukprot:218455_1